MTLSSVDRTLEVLDILVDRGSVGVTELATVLCVSASTAHRILETLQARNYVAQDAETKRYRPGSRMLGLSHELELIERSRAVVAEVGERTEMTVHLGVLQGRQVRYVHAWSPEASHAIGSRVGTSMYAHATAAGKALLSTQPAKSLMRVFPGAALPSQTPASIRYRHDLLDELYTVRRTGCARNLEESERGVIGFAAPVNARRQYMALTVSAWTADFEPALGSRRERQIAGVLHRASSRLEHMLCQV